MSLNDWLINGWLVELRPTRNEIADLFHIIERDLKDCEITKLSPDRRFNTAYNAALQCAKAALAVAGY